MIRIRTKVIVAGASAALAAGLGLAPAHAASQGSAIGRVNVAVRAINVSPTEVLYSSCVYLSSPQAAPIDTHGSLVFPNGECAAPVITVTNGGEPGHILVGGGDMIGSDDVSATPPNPPSPHWQLCGGVGGVACNGASPSLPGADQYEEGLGNGQTDNVVLQGNDQGDANFGADGSATPGQSVGEVPDMTGPSQSTDPSTSFQTIISWIATP